MTLLKDLPFVLFCLFAGARSPPPALALHGCNTLHFQMFSGSVTGEALTQRSSATEMEKMRIFYSTLCIYKK